MHIYQKFLKTIPASDSYPSEEKAHNEKDQPIEEWLDPHMELIIKLKHHMYAYFCVMRAGNYLFSNKDKPRTKLYLSLKKDYPSMKADWNQIEQNKDRPFSDEHVKACRDLNDKIWYYANFENDQ